MADDKTAMERNLSGMTELLNDFDEINDLDDLAELLEKLGECYMILEDEDIGKGTTISKGLLFLTNKNHKPTFIFKTDNAEIELESWEVLFYAFDTKEEATECLKEYYYGE